MCDELGYLAEAMSKPSWKEQLDLLSVKRERSERN